MTINWLTICDRLVPQTVEDWRSNLASSKANHKKLAATIASPTENPDLFEEGWKAALEREAGLKSTPSSGYDIVEHAGLSLKFIFDDI